jgi:hypothetical protein
MGRALFAISPEVGTFLMLKKESMPKVTFMLGLAGSGKTHQGKKIAEESNCDFFEENQFFQTPFLDCLRQGKDCVVEEICYCVPNNRTRLLDKLSKIPNLIIEWICFENDIESANWNCDHRQLKGDPEQHKQANLCVSLVYTYPDGAQIWPIIRTEPKKK